MSSLLDDLAEESLADALENGNLRGEKSRAERAAQHPPMHRNQWVSEGYHASIHCFSCKNCGASWRTLHGVFHTERAQGTTSIRAQNLDLGSFQIPLDAHHETRFSQFSTKVCVSCVGAYGFSPDAKSE